ncbi:MAG: four helix bundle protein [bacterium]|nr:four helix bundle protein [bacterium]
MSAQSFDHERLDVRSTTLLDYSRRHNHSKGFITCSRSVASCCAVDTTESRRAGTEGNGKRSLKDRARFLDIARGSALECAAIQDVLVTTKGIKVQDDAAMKAMLHRIVAMLTRMAMRFDGVSEPGEAYDTEIDYDNEHRCAEHEHGRPRTEETLEPWDATERWWRVFL